MEEAKFTHFDDKGDAIMVDVSDKTITHREATASGRILVSQEVMDAVCSGSVKKGDVLGVARIAGIMAVKQTSHLIPLCHALPITSCKVEFELQPQVPAIKVFCTVKVDGKTGVEMEALTGVQVTLLTIYDMCKAIDKRMEMTEIHLETKTGGKSGDFHR